LYSPPSFAYVATTVFEFQLIFSIPLRVFSSRRSTPPPPSPNAVDFLFLVHRFTGSFSSLPAPSVHLRLYLSWNLFDEAFSRLDTIGRPLRTPECFFHIFIQLDRFYQLNITLFFDVFTMFPSFRLVYFFLQPPPPPSVGSFFLFDSLP